MDNRNKLTPLEAIYLYMAFVHGIVPQYGTDVARRTCQTLREKGLLKMTAFEVTKAGGNILKELK
jgi:hypothetical protein